MPILNIAWWNLENLFDAESATRPPELASVLKNELKGWTAAIRDEKIDRLAAILKLMFAGAGPDLLGVAEAESEAVLKLLAARMNLPGRAYKVLHHASPDTRGIDTSFIYDASTLTPSAAKHFVVAKRRGTRDLFWATFQPKAGSAPFVALANHWPARSEGQYESEPFRMMVAETASYVLERLFALNPAGDKLPVVLMGDFNDEPFNRAIEEYLLSSHDEKAVTRGRAPNVFNLMCRCWPDRSREPTSLTAGICSTSSSPPRGCCWRKARCARTPPAWTFSARRPCASRAVRRVASAGRPGRTISTRRALPIIFQSR